MPIFAGDERDSLRLVVLSFSQHRRPRWIIRCFPRSNRGPANDLCLGVNALDKSKARSKGKPDLFAFL
ncbi:MAG: hypothetical protein DMG76_14515 [Acidobacteria bacterium]|nr:MAG: hypothetical protein AUH11_17170 [Acidobacteria bacterium 13_2_20CM_57_17]OLB91502.1 MAG: hypothetical protein AUI02_09485 [Acidobacteria bacterium 13_2_20CM_2_57_12]OLE16137.1 MAG: hypothetical protein AUG83_04220 [Acidobacteria bacterium 13_1_20CM_4_57_11]PYX56517.1 MAG: hypothetical protein DMG76_14515 [Acidobacteriota bacterium]